MCTCEFCGKSFCPRAQVKNPRACSRKGCQRERQRRNELEWRRKNSDRYGPEYFKKWRKSAHKRKMKIKVVLVKSLEIGCRFMEDGRFSLADLNALVTDFLNTLGVRDINKFCNT